MAQGELLTNGGDAPLHTGQKSETSSLGLVWPPEKTSYKRMKGFYFTAVQTDNDFAEFNDEWNKAIKSPDFSVDGQYSRITMRAVVNNEFLLSHAEALSGMVEAIIPLEGGVENVFEGMSLVYFGTNHPDRKSDEFSLNGVLENRSHALLEEEQSPQKLISKPSKEGYIISGIEKDKIYKAGDDEVTQLYTLYQPFAWKEDEIVEMLNSNNRMITVAKKDNVIVSAGIAEKEAVQIMFGETPYQLDLIELTDAATLVAHEGGENHEGKGLYSAVSTFAINEISHLYRDSNQTPQAVLVFGESNVKQKGLLIACVRQGRDIAEGMLQKHVPILDPGEDREKEKTRYNSFFPTYIGKSKMHRIYGNN